MQKNPKALLDELHALEQADPIDHQRVDQVLEALRQHPPEHILWAVDQHPKTARLEELEARPVDWQNWSRNLETDEVSIQRPTTLQELIQAVEVGASGGLKPLGSGFSCSPASQPATQAAAFDLAHLSATLPLEGLRDGVDTSMLQRVEVGITLQALAERLDEHQLALPNLGGFTGQTLAGALSTGTHATGLEHPPLPDMVISVDIVLKDAEGNVGVHRFEPTGGITDPASSPFPLVQDDDAFYAMVVNCGTIGIAYAYTVQLIEPYWVAEHIEAFVFEDDFDQALQRARQGENLSFTLSAYPDDTGKHPGILTRFERLSRDQVPANEWNAPPVRKDSRAFEAWLADVIGTRAIGWFLKAFPRLVQHQILRFFDKSVTSDDNPPFRSIYYRVYPRETSDDFRATFTEASVPLDELQQALGRVFTDAEAARAQGRYRFLVPIACRFVGGSKHLLSMQQGSDHGTIEAFVVRGTGEDAALYAVHTQAGGRPHWGQLLPLGTVDGPAKYPDTWSTFVTQWQRWNPTGVFRGPIVGRMGLGTHEES